MSLAGLKIKGVVAVVCRRADGSWQALFKVEDVEPPLQLTKPVANVVAIGVAFTDPPLDRDAERGVVIGACFEFVNRDGRELDLVDFDKATGEDNCDISDATATVRELEDVLKLNGGGRAGHLLQLACDKCFAFKVLPRFAFEEASTLAFNAVFIIKTTSSGQVGCPAGDLTRK